MDDVMKSLNVRSSKGWSLTDSDMGLKQKDLTDVSQSSPSKKKNDEAIDSKSREGEVCTSNTRSLFKDDFNLFKEDFTLFKEELANAFKLNLSKESVARTTTSETSRSRERDDKGKSALSLFKDDFNLFKEDLSNVFKIGPSKEKEEKDSPSKTKHLEEDFTAEGISYEKAKRTTHCGIHPFNLPKMNPPKDDSTGTSEILHCVEKTNGSNSFESEWRAAETIEEALSKECWTDLLKPDLSKDTEKKTTVSTPERDDWTGSEDCSVVLRTDQSSERGKEEEYDPLTSLQWQTEHFTIRDPEGTDPHDEAVNGQLGEDLWSVKRYAFYLTLDPSTANQELLLSGDNRKVTRVWSDNMYPNHPERFKSCPQVLCREALLDRVYWEVEWKQGADVGVTYSSISREGDVNSCVIGHNDKSWSLECSEGSYTPVHNNKRCKSSLPVPFSHRVGVYLDWSGGTLSFYCVSPDTITHLHTFQTTFTEPVYPGFWVWDYDASVSLCQVQLEWERLL